MPTAPDPSLPHHGGGFLLSPPASTISSPYAASTSASTSSHRGPRSGLPHPRSKPLNPGGSKESAFIRYADAQYLSLQRRFAQRAATTTGDGDDDDDIRQPPIPPPGQGPGHPRRREELHFGYTNMRQACRDVESLLDMVWLSGTPSLQVPYLLNLGVFVCELVRGMRVSSPKSLFALLRKCDHAFASLLQGRDVESGERLPGFFGAKGVSGTEKVRIRSLVERTRVSLFQVFDQGEFEEDEEEEEDERGVGERGEDDGEDEERMNTDGETNLEGELVLEGGLHERLDEGDESWNMQLARVYDRTMVELGDSLEEPTIGIITEERGRRGGDTEIME